MTLETLITLLTIENNIIKNHFVSFILTVTGTAFSILEIFLYKDEFVFGCLKDEEVIAQVMVE